MSKNPKLITAESVEHLRKLDNWTVYEVPTQCWDKMDFVPRPGDLIAIYASGTQSEPEAVHGQLSHIGLDVIAHEPNPKPTSKYGPEPDINIYHVIIQKTRHNDGDEYLAHGPYLNGTHREHWPKDTDEAIKYYCDVGKSLDLSD